MCLSRRSSVNGLFRASLLAIIQIQKKQIGVPPSQAKGKDSMPADQGIQETEQKERFEIRLNRMIIFFRGIARAGAVGLFVALVLAVTPWFEPDIQPFQTRLIDFIQQYAIPICSALLIWSGLRAAL